MLTINLVWDADAKAAPQSFRDAITAAAQVLESVITNNITVNISIGYGEFGLGTVDYTRLNSNYSLGGITEGVDISYTALKDALGNAASDATDEASIAALPATDALNGQTDFFLSSAQAKALGAISPTATAIDGYAGFPTIYSGTDLEALAITELIHAMGLLSGGGGALELFQYTSAGVHFLPSSTTSRSQAYFSVDGGQTRLAYYDTGYDETLFENLPSDALNTPSYGVTTLSALDLEEISAIGYNVTTDAAPAVQDITPIITGGVATVQARSVTLGEHATIAAAALIASATEPAAGDISSYLFYDEGGNRGYFIMDGVTQASGQDIYVLSTQLDTLAFVSGAQPGSDTVLVAAYDYSAATYSSFSDATVTAEADAACFLAGTAIRTATGEAPIETLQIGDIILTETGPRPIKFIGRSHYDGRFVGNNAKLLPIRITAGALGPNLPARDLHLSPGHCLWLESFLIPAGLLVNGVNIRQAGQIERLDYYHIEFEDHAILFAEGCAAESFYAAADVPPFHNEAEFRRRYPEGRKPHPRCAPLLQGGRKLAIIERKILARAKTLARGYAELPRLLEILPDGTQRVEIHAWAQYLPPALAAQPVALTIAVAGRRCKELANHAREDLRAAGIGTGRHGLRLALRLPANAPLHRLSVRVALNGQKLPFTEAALAAFPAPARNARPKTPPRAESPARRPAIAN